MTVEWELLGKVLTACNCDWGCPCNFNAPPTNGKCEGGWTWHIEEGSYGDVCLDGLNFSIYAKWPGAIHHGNGEAVIFIDERADGAQRSALETLAGGTAGGPWGVLMWTWPKVHGPYPADYDVVFDGVKSKLKCGTVLEIEGATICNPLSGAEAHPGVILPEGLIFKRGNFGSSVRFRLSQGLEYDHSGKYFAIGSFDYFGPHA